MVNIIKNGDIFTVSADILINPVNRAGISGAGLAKEFKNRFPRYEEMWRLRRLFPIPVGEIDMVDLGRKYRLCYLPTKHHPSDKNSDLILVTLGLSALKDRSLASHLVINMPALGCGLGGLDFEGVVKPLIVDLFEHEPCMINLFEPK